MPCRSEPHALGSRPLRGPPGLVSPVGPAVSPKTPQAALTAAICYTEVGAKGWLLTDPAPANRCGTAQPLPPSQVPCTPLL